MFFQYNILKKHYLPLNPHYFDFEAMEKAELKQNQQKNQQLPADGTLVIASDAVDPTFEIAKSCLQQSLQLLKELKNKQKNS